MTVQTHGQANERDTHQKSAYPFLWNGFQIYFVARKLHQDSVSCGHSAFDKVFLTQVTHFVELPKSSNFACIDLLFTANSLRLLIIPISHTPFGEHSARAEDGGDPSRSNHCCIKDMFFGKSCEQTMFLGDKAKRFFGLRHVSNWIRMLFI